MKPIRGRFRFGRRLLYPYSFRDPFLRETARRLSAIVRRALETFETARFMRELRSLMLAHRRDGPRRA